LFCQYHSTNASYSLINYRRYKILATNVTPYKTQPIILIHFFPYGSSALIRAVASSESRLLDSFQLDTPHSVGLLWTSDQLDAQTSPNPTHSTYNRQTSTSRRHSNPQSQQVSVRRPTP